MLENTANKLEFYTNQAAKSSVPPPPNHRDLRNITDVLGKSLIDLEERLSMLMIQAGYLGYDEPRIAYLQEMAEKHMSNNEERKLSVMDKIELAGARLRIMQEEVSHLTQFLVKQIV